MSKFVQVLKNGKVVYDKTGGYTGFLGNVLFQTAATIGIAVKNGMDYIFPHKSYFDAFVPSLPIERDMSKFQLETYTDYNEKNYHYDEVILNPNENYNLTGYYQSKKYWEHCAIQIREYFMFNDTIKQAALSKYPAFVQNSYDRRTRISMHIRRGDYLQSPDHHPVLPLDYYVEAINRMENDLYRIAASQSCATLNMDLFRSSIRYVVFSNDINWCKQAFADHRIIDKITFIEGNTQEEDMFLMTQCQHHIIANSSMSWWGSYLSIPNLRDGKIVIAPSKDKWYGKEYAHWNLDDLYLDSWITI